MARRRGAYAKRRRVKRGTGRRSQRAYAKLQKEVREGMDYVYDNTSWLEDVGQRSAAAKKMRDAENSYTRRLRRYKLHPRGKRVNYWW